MEIYFLRHGEAGKQSDWKGEDSERPLNAEGVTRMKREASAIASLGLHLELIVTSPYVRALQTADFVARALGLAGSPVIDDRLSPGFSRDGLAQVLAAHSDRAALMLVGHDPDFCETISACTGGGRVECKKGSLVRVGFDDPANLRGVLRWLIPPKLLAP